MNQKIVKQVVGIDVAQQELVVSLGRMYEDLSTELYAHKAFANNAKGFLALVTWVKEKTDRQAGSSFVMEATGVYHESLAYFLDEKGYPVSIILPNKISNYMRTLSTKTVTDKTSAQAIALFGLERKLDQWQRPSPTYKRLRQLTRERDQLMVQRTMAKNHLHAEKAEAEPNAGSLARINKQISLFTKQITEIQTEVGQLIQEHAELKVAITRSCSIPGIGVITAATILAETNGFALIQNKKQLVSYAGLDVREKQSGTSVKGKARISKKGNRYLRKCLYMPALATIRSNERMKAIFARLVSRHGIKKKAAVAIQRKLLEMMFCLHKKNELYDPNHYKKLGVTEVTP